MTGNNQDNHLIETSDIKIWNFTKLSGTYYCLEDYISKLTVDPTDYTTYDFENILGYSINTAKTPEEYLGMLGMLFQHKIYKDDQRYDVTTINKKFSLDINIVDRKIDFDSDMVSNVEIHGLDEEECIMVLLYYDHETIGVAEYDKDHKCYWFPDLGDKKLPILPESKLILSVISWPINDENINYNVHCKLYFIEFSKKISMLPFYTDYPICLYLEWLGKFIFFEDEGMYGLSSIEVGYNRKEPYLEEWMIDCDLDMLDKFDNFDYLIEI